MSSIPPSSRLALVLVLAGLPWAATHQAYTLLGPAWPGSSEQYWVNPVNQDGLAPAAVIDAVRYAADQWSSSNPEHDAYFDAIYAGTTTRQTIAYNGFNDVFFANESGGAIATAYTWWIGDTIVESDIVFWDEKTFFTGTAGCLRGYYVEDIATHEMGHFVGVGHTGVTGATMRPKTSRCNQNLRTLAPDDLAAIEALYPDAGVPSIPEVPTGLTASATIDPSVQLTWNDVAGEDRYVVERSLDNVNFVTWAQTGANQTTLVDTAVDFDTTYWYRLRAGNAGGDSAPSVSPVSSTPLTLPTTPTR